MPTFDWLLCACALVLLARQVHTRPFLLLTSTCGSWLKLDTPHSRKTLLLEVHWQGVSDGTELQTARR